eukprot:TRINITY_DN4542_c0_g1_i1.p1 TRINITY_DN4542_c0_g1~~TRINITY_DN4542_c0_g1_i1.p1  ORF type:complete len:330 (-),score=11.71 TRINITY_DN4542_c0_g1_i1:301-1290(-)
MDPLICGTQELQLEEKIRDWAVGMDLLLRPELPLVNPTLQDSTHVNDLPSCPVCLLEASSFRTFSCGHKYCPPCISSYISCSIQEHPEYDFFKCIEPACSHRLTDHEVNTSVTNDVTQMYAQHQRSRHFRVLYCPSPLCSQAVAVSPPLRVGERRNIKCTACGYKFCSKCKSDSHFLNNCSLFATADSKSFLNWMNGNGKCCPSCWTPITKTEGCDHMTCRRCQYSFCYLCGLGWDGPHCGSQARFGWTAGFQDRLKERLKGGLRAMLRGALYLVFLPVVLPAGLFLCAREFWWSRTESCYPLSSLCRKLERKRQPVADLFFSIFLFFS